MSLSDRAFIKAYSLDQAETSPPAPHLPLESGLGAPAPSVEQLYAPAAQPSIDVTPPPQPIPEQNTTHFVPEPHFVAAPHAQPRETQRQPLYDSTETVPEPEPVAFVAPTTQPLSSFVTQPVVQDSFEPALEVLGFPWPAEADELLHRQPAHWDQLARDLTGPHVHTSNILAVTGSSRGEGRSTAVICLARALARQGAKTVMVDADFSSPTLATQLGLGVESGWEDAISGSVPLSETMILSQEERLALLPLAGGDPNLAEMAGNMQVAVHLQMLAEKYHTVLVDLGPVDSPDSPALRLLHGIGSAGAVLVCDQRATDPNRMFDVAQRVTLSGVTVLGRIDNFTSSKTPKPHFEPATNPGPSQGGIASESSTRVLQSPSE